MTLRLGERIYMKYEELLSQIFKLLKYEDLFPWIFQKKKNFEKWLFESVDLLKKFEKG